jgi:hypothetical protein
MKLFVIDCEGGLYEEVGIIAWLLSDRPFWGFQIGKRRFVHDEVLLRHGYVGWRRGNNAA